MKRIILPILVAAVVACTPAQEGNIAKHKTAVASSSWDHNLTAQLLTDGIVPNEAPAWLELNTPDGPVDRVERENTLDNDSHTRNMLSGDHGWIEYRTHGYTIDADAADVLYQEEFGSGKSGPKYNVHLPVKPENGAIRLSLDFPHEGRWRVKEVSFTKDGSVVEGVLPSEHFSSAWMSAGCGEEWVSVDLGSIVKVDSVKLHWINLPASHNIEISRNAKRWKAASHGKCRFIRVKMSGGTADALPYCLGEIEAFGSQAKEPQQDGWKVCRDGSNDWIPASVPGTVLMSFIKAGAVPDPDFGDNWEQISESYFNSDFWYKKEFYSNGTPAGMRSFLDMGGINWKADVLLNGTQLGRIEGAFMRGHYDITDILCKGRNELLIRIIHNAHPGAVKEKTARWTGYNGGVLGADNPTFHASIGWDWMTTVRGRNIGIWGDVKIVQKGVATLADPTVVSSVSENGTASMTASVVLKDLAGKTAEVEGWIGDICFSKEVVAAGEVSFCPEEFPQLKDRQMNLWWPNGYGEPSLYDAGFIVKVDGAPADTVVYKAGIREVRSIEDGGALKLFVNGLRVNPMGGNWGFCQQNLEYSPEQYDIAVGYHAQMHFNMIRNWVGQVPHEAFFAACDRHGIMVWQDFWLANPSDGPDPDDEEMFLANARDWVYRIRRHPCLTLYCGRNEGYPPESLDVRLRESVVAGPHPGMPYISSSADGPVSGHGPYRAMPTEYYFNNQSGKLHSERGMPNVPVIESMRKMMPEENLWPQGKMWGKHDFTTDGAQKAASYNAMMDEAFGPCESAEEFSTLAQWLNYDGYRAMFESENSAGRNGLLLWMSHSCWPSMVWCTYDYYFQPGGAFFGCKKACEPLHIQYNAATGMVEIINNSFLPDSDGLCAVVRVYGYRGNLISEKKEKFDVATDSTVECFKADAPEGEPTYYLKLQLLSGTGTLLSENFYVMGDRKILRTLPGAWLVKKVKGTQDGADVTVKNTSKSPALFIRLAALDKNKEEILPVDWSDNYFCLMPGEEKSVQLKLRRPCKYGIKVYESR